MSQIAESRFSYGVSGAADARPTLGHLLLRTPGMLNLWYERSRQRRQLGRLDDRLLRDIGIDRATVEMEVSKPFWRP